MQKKYIPLWMYVCAVKACSYSKLLTLMKISFLFAICKVFMNQDENNFAFKIRNSVDFWPQHALSRSSNH